MLDSYIKWVKAHEKMLLIVLFFGVAGFLGNKYLNYSAAKADAQNQAAQQVLEAQKEANGKLALQNQEAQAQYQVLLGQLNAQNQRLTAEMLTLSQTLAARQKQDAALPLPELATRWENLLSLPASSISSTENGLQVTPDASRATVLSLESLPVVRQQLSDETQIADNRSKELNSSQSLVTGLQSQVTGLQLQITDADKACVTEVDAVKKDARKGKRNWFVTGLLTGAALVAKFAI